MTTPALTSTSSAPPAISSVAHIDDLDRVSWDRLLKRTSAATPFSSWTFHRAWWDAYGAGAEPHYLAIGQDPVLGIMPLMARVPGEDLRGRRYFAASYHADYATALAADGDLDTVAEATIDHLAGRNDWSVLDLRRFRADDAFLARLEAVASQRADELGWRVRREQEDVCPALPLAGSWDEQLARLSKKTRHEFRRKLRRAQAAGPLRLHYLPLDAAAADRFIELHQARWDQHGLFAPGETGTRSRRFLHRLVELEGAQAEPSFHIAETTVGDRVIHVAAGFAAGGTCYFYNAGMDPGALELSPGVVGTALYIRDRIARGEKRFDFLRGDEPYKYEWGATDQSLCRLVIEPRDAA